LTNSQNSQTKKHISYSEYKNWSECPWRHKLVYIDKIPYYSSNQYTAFGTAIHEVCEKMSLGRVAGPAQGKLLFEKTFDKELSTIANQIDESLKKEFVEQGQRIIPQIMPALKEHFGEFEVVSAEEALYEPIEEISDVEYKFKGFIDLVIKTPDDKYHIIDWKTCSWGWNFQKKTNPLITYQLTLYKNYFVKKYGIDSKKAETYFILLKRTAKHDNVEICRITSGSKKTNNAIKSLERFLYNIDNGKPFKNRLSCKYCVFKSTENCP